MHSVYRTSRRLYTSISARTSGRIDDGAIALEVSPYNVQTGSNGVAKAVMALGPTPGINNNVAQATIASMPGLPASFVFSALATGDPSETTFSGTVLDSGHTPIPGAVVAIEGTGVSDTTDEEGAFRLENVPVGHVGLNIDPSASPRPETFPELLFETVTIAGRNNTLGQAIVIPALQTDSSRLVGGNEDVTLTMPGIAGLSLTVFANSVTCPDGSSECQVSISQVHLDKVPMPPPSGTFFMPPAWTIQPAGVSFDPPARITIPNDGLVSAQAYPLGAPTVDKVAITETYYFRVRDYTPPVAVSASAAADSISLDTPEGAALTHFSSMLAGDYQRWLGNWDEESRRGIVARNEERGRDAAFWTGRWTEALEPYSSCALTQRVDSDAFAIIVFRCSGAEDGRDDLGLDVVLTKDADDTWRPTNTLADDPVFLYWRNPSTPVERMVREPPGR